MIYPKIVFKKSAKRDFDTACAFAKDSKYDSGRGLQWAIFNKYPEFELYFDKENSYSIKNKSALFNSIKDIYRDKRDEINIGISKQENDWRKLEMRFYKLVDVLFENRKWPSLKYIAYGTIWSMFPRFLEQNAFQIPYKHRLPKYVPVIIAHELLHFIFFDYFYKRFPKYKKEKYQFFVWHVSEVFNSIVQNSPPWVKLFKQIPMDYPEHEQILKKIGRYFQKNNIIDIDELTDNIIHEIQEDFPTSIG